MSAIAEDNKIANMNVLNIPPKEEPAVPQANREDQPPMEPNSTNAEPIVPPSESRVKALMKMGEELAPSLVLIIISVVLHRNISIHFLFLLSSSSILYYQ